MKRLEPIVKNYDWGMEDIAHPYVDVGDKKVAELWWKGESFLLKLLFVSKPLSLQVHPSQSQLHQYSFPDPYPKPEIVIALQDGFQALCGFKETKHQLLAHHHFQSLFSLNQHSVKDLLREMEGYAEGHAEEEEECRIFLELRKMHGDDPTVLAPFYMNYVCLKAGEALIIPATQPHCYLSGYGMECMPPSDNVVRCGLTTKECQRELFFEMCCPPQSPIIQTYPYDHEELSKYFQIRRTPTSCPKGAIVLVLGVGAWRVEEENMKVEECPNTWVVVPMMD